MTLRTQQPTPENAPAVLTNEQRRRVAGTIYVEFIEFMTKL